MTKKINYVVKIVKHDIRLKMIEILIFTKKVPCIFNHSAA